MDRNLIYHNEAIDTVTFVITLPVHFGANDSTAHRKRSPRSVLNCLARAMETNQNPVIQSAVKGLFDWIYDRSTPEERRFFPNWFEGQ